MHCQRATRVRRSTHRKFETPESENAKWMSQSEKERQLEQCRRHELTAATTHDSANSQACAAPPIRPKTARVRSAPHRSLPTPLCLRCRQPVRAQSQQSAFKIHHPTIATTQLLHRTHFGFVQRRFVVADADG